MILELLRKPYSLLHDCTQPAPDLLEVAGRRGGCAGGQCRRQGGAAGADREGHVRAGVRDGAAEREGHCSAEGEPGRPGAGMPRGAAPLRIYQLPAVHQGFSGACRTVHAGPCWGTQTAVTFSE